MSASPVFGELASVARQAFAFDAQHAPAYAVVAASSLFYTWLWYRPRAFVSLVGKGGDPCKVMAVISNILKVAQFGLIAYAVNWSGVYARLVEPVLKGGNVVALSLAGLALLFFLLGQHLNYFVMLRLKVDGVYYGVRFGKTIPWVHDYPYNVKWLRDPQYLGGILSNVGVAIAAPNIADVCFFWILNYLYLVWLESAVPSSPAADGKGKKVAAKKA